MKSIKIILISGIVGFTGAIICMVIVIFLGSFLGTFGKLFASAYFFPGIILAMPLSDFIEPILMKLVPQGGAPVAFVGVIPFVLLFWTIVFVVIYSIYKSKKLNRTLSNKVKQ